MCRAGNLSLVSRAFKTACEEAQLCETEVRVTGSCFANFHSYLPWFQRYTPRMRTLTIQCTSSGESFLLPYQNPKLKALLESASATQGKLRHLTLSHPKVGWQQALSCLTQLESLHVNDWYATEPSYLSMSYWRIVFTVSHERTA